MPAVSAKASFRARQLTAALICVLMLGALAYLLYLAATGTAVVSRKVTPDVAQVHLEHVLPPPPPPPPPPKQKFVAQPKDKTQAFKTPEQPTPRPQQSPSPPGPKTPATSPALATQGQGPPDSFGLTGDPNGRDYVGGGGGGGSAFGDYAAMLELRVREQLSRDRRLRGVHYHVYIEVWITPDGHVQRSQYIGGSGKADVDRNIQESLRTMARLTQPLPEAMPQPIVMHLSSTD